MESGKKDIVKIRNLKCTEHWQGGHTWPFHPMRRPKTRLGRCRSGDVFLSKCCLDCSPTKHQTLHQPTGMPMTGLGSC